MEVILTRSSIEFSVILPVYNGEATLQRQLDALVVQEWDGSWEVLIVDNDSDDGTPSIIAKMCEEYPGMFRSVTAVDQHNVGYARNVGVDGARGRAIGFCDADDIVGAGWVAALGAALRSETLVGSRLDNALLNPPEVAAVSKYQTEAFGTLFDRPVVAGGGLGCLRSTWLELGGMNGDYIAEDTEFSLRVGAVLGIVPAFVPDAVYHVQLRQTVTEEFRRGLRQSRSVVQLFAAYGSARHRRRPRSVVVGYVQTAVLLRHMRSEDGRRIFFRELGRQCGRIGGSIRYRRIFL